MIEIRCKKKECRCSENGKLLAKVSLPPGKKPLGITIELACPQNKKRKVAFHF